jgi:murein DD-endopeptidase MepM/ murein hydrolase activator NlpD
MTFRSRRVVLGALATILLGGVAAGLWALARDGSSSPSASSTPTEVAPVDGTPTEVAVAEPSPTPTVAPTAIPTPLPTSPPPVVQVLERAPPPLDSALAMADVLSNALVSPSDCPLPLGVAASMPNASRNYRSGVHQGIDFICGERGRSAVAALPGRIAVAVGDYIAPDPTDRNSLLVTAGRVGRTPPYTLVMLYGNYVVIDHGIIQGVGHVISLHAHLDSVDADLRVGQLVDAGQRLGEIGNLGTDSASTGVLDLQSLHLHWELHVDDLYLGAGLSTSETRQIYSRLFGVDPS